jgi:cytochrome c biogenesis protein CcmG/thiol:disulfide interchange protein DsbE
MRLFFITPMAIFLVVILLLMAKLLDTQKLAPSPLIGKPLPEFSLKSVYDGKDVFSSGDLKGKYTLLNVFASWCLTCKIEHPTLMKIKNDGKLAIYGIDWKDRNENILKYLKDGGDPYTKIGADFDGSVIIKLGVTGAPETFLISPDGIILYRYAGVITEQVLNTEILPLIK